MSRATHDIERIHSAKDVQMTTLEIQRQYDEIIAPNYDLDPLSVTVNSLNRALAQLQSEGCLAGILPRMDALDVGMGTGLFYERLYAVSERAVRPFGLDISRQMIDVAKTRVPDLVAAVDDAANISCHFAETPFDLICTHFVTGFVPLNHLAPAIHSKLKPGGYWSFVGGTSRAFPELQRIAASPIISRLFGAKNLDLSGLNTPFDQDEVVKTLRDYDFQICDAETFEPRLDFANFDEFMRFAWSGGWLTPFIEDLGLQNAGRLLRALLNMLVFPVDDLHRIAIILARKRSNHV